MRPVLIALSMVVPMLMRYSYPYVNEHWTVKQFGCGCTRLDGSWFNANHFNMMMWGTIASVCMVAYGYNIYRICGPGSACDWILPGGAMIIAAICLASFAQGVCCNAKSERSS